MCSEPRRQRQGQAAAAASRARARDLGRLRPQQLHPRGARHAHAVPTNGTHPEHFRFFTVTNNTEKHMLVHMP